MNNNANTFILIFFSALLFISCSKDRTSYKAACKQKNGAACNELAFMNLYGIGGSKSRARAKSLFKKACNLSFNDSCKMYGNLSYAKNDNDKNSRKYQKKGCNGGDKVACVNWAWMLWHAEGGNRNVKKAEELFKKACKQKLSDGCFFAALLLQFKKQNKQTSATSQNQSPISFFEKACKLGDNIACQKVAQ